MSVSLFIKSITLPTGEVIELKSDSIIVFVGPNNSGKSTALRDIQLHLNDHNHVATVIKDIVIDKIGTLEDLKDEISEFKQPNGTYNASNHSFYENSLDEWWGKSKGIGFLASRYCMPLPTDVRLVDAQSASSFNPINQQPSHPVQQMFRDPIVEKAVCAQFRKAFGQDIVVHRFAGNGGIPLYVGEYPKFLKGEDPISLSYLKRIEALPLLSSQGDGMKSFATLVSRLVASDIHSIFLIDEPEAFLHPPQARQLGELIASSHKQKRQIFIATHSNEVIQGVLAHHPDRVSVIRLQRDAGLPEASYLPNAQILNLWKNPILRYSNVLSGLFHKGVIITEADADCRFYEALSETISNSSADLLYTYSSGKERITVIATALKALNVPVVGIVDIDIFNDENVAERLVVSFGGDWNLFKSDFLKIKASIEKQNLPLTGKQFKSELSTITSKLIDEDFIQKATVKELKRLAKKANPWALAKENGIQSIPPSERSTALTVIEALKDIGIFVVPVGEMESFCKDIVHHGPKWVDAALENDLQTAPEFEEARKFIDGVLKSLS